LAVKCNEDRLTATELTEYEAYLQASTLIGILQANARRVIAQSKVGKKAAMTSDLERLLDQGLENLRSAKATEELRRQSR
jgi:hypothetical protein